MATQLYRFSSVLAGGKSTMLDKRQEWCYSFPTAQLFTSTAIIPKDSNSELPQIYARLHSVLVLVIEGHVDTELLAVGERRCWL